MPETQSSASPAQEMSRLVREFGWASTLLGPPANWSGSLRAVTELLLAHPFAMIVLWGPELVQIYNDAYRIIMGRKHPGGLGQPTRECWPEVWSFNEPIYQGVMERGETFEFSDQPLTIQRHGRDEDAFFTLSFSPVWAESGAVGGVLVTVIETTERVQAEREAQARQAEVESRNRALAAFAELSRDLSLDTDSARLIRQAQTALLPLFPGGFSQYYEPEGGFWALRSQVGPVDSAELQLGLEARLPFGAAPNLRVPWDSGEAYYQNEDDQSPGSALPGLRSSVTLPVRVGTQMRGVLGFTLGQSHRWSRPDRAVLETVERSLNLALERAEQSRRLEEERSALAAFTAFAEGAGTDTDLGSLVRRAAAVLQSVFDDASVAYHELDGDLWVMKAWSDDVNPVLVDLLRAGLPESTPAFQRAVREQAAVFIDDWNAQHEQVAFSGRYRASSVYPLALGGQIRATFNVARRRTQQWSKRDQGIVRAVGRSLSLALERAEQTRLLDEQRAALSAFARFTESSAQMTDVLVLARQATSVLQATLGNVDVVYYEREGGLWRARVHSSGLDEALVQASLLGFSADLPPFRAFALGRGGVFLDGWNGDGMDIEQTQQYGAAAGYPYFEYGSPYGLLTAYSQQRQRWSERERSIFLAVARSLGLAFERLRQNRQLSAQNAELEARTRALEAFANLTRDLTLESDPYALIRRAQEVVLSLLPDGYTIHFEVENNRWVVKAQTGDLRSEALQDAADQGLPYAETNNLLIPYTTLEPYYQNQYAQNTDNLDELVGHIGASATVPVIVNGRPRGIFAVVLFGGERPWDRADQAVLESVVRSLGLALERAESLARLERRTEELRRSNAELEQFAYVASHDLQEPLRSVTSFSQLLASRYADATDEKAQKYVQYITEGTGRMAQLIQDLLAFSRVATHVQAFRPVKTRLIVAQVLQDLRDQIERSGAEVSFTALPEVLGDSTQLRQVFQNLIGNAIKFGHPSRPPRIGVSAVREGDLWHFSVSDNGEGIEPQHFERIFVIFQRLHTRDQFGGNGMGLAIVKKIVERHGGAVTLSSEKGMGTTFSFTLPVLPPEA
jgi:signal transduction histidine kinase